MAMKVFQVDANEELEPFAFERERLGAAGIGFSVGNCTTEDEVIARAGDSEVLWVGWLSIVGPKVMDALPNLRMLIRWGVGYDQFDVPEATKRGIACANAPSYGSDDVAEHAVALLLSGARRVPWYHERMRRGGWSDGAELVMHRMRGRTLGVIGVGRIGGGVAWRGKGLGLNVIGYDLYKPADELRAVGVEPVSLDDLLARSDYISINCPLSSTSRGMIGAGQLAKMRPDVVLVNTARGPIIDELALIASIRDGRGPAVAALDVFDFEPLSSESPLRGFENVILTPHSASFTLEAMQAIRAEMCATTVEFLTTGWTGPVVNPEVRPTLRPRVS